MTRSKLSLISLLLVLTMIAGVLASCGPTFEDESTDATTQINEPDATDTKDGSESSDATESSKTSETSESSETDGSSESSEESTNVEDTVNTYVADESLLIENANALANGVNAFFTDGERTNFIVENQNMTLDYALMGYDDTQVSYLNNKDGKSYIENTMDIFIRMQNGETYYASNSTTHATANLFRFGYYYYEARLERQLFISDIVIEGEQKLPIDIKTQHSLRDSVAEDGALRMTLKSDDDPYIIFNNINFSTEEYNYLQITMRTSNQKANHRGLQLYMLVNGATGYTDANSVRFTGYTNGEYVVYNVPLDTIANYKGNVTGLRLDVEGDIGSYYDIAEMKALKVTSPGTLKGASLARSFMVYSDKMHHYAQIAVTEEITDVAEIGTVTRIPKDKVAKLIVHDKNKNHDSLDNVDWDSVEYLAFDIVDAGIFGYILPCDDESGKIKVELVDGQYVITQTLVPDDNTLIPSGTYDAGKKMYVSEPGAEGNANDVYMGQRIYTDTTHDFDTFLNEAECERNPLIGKNIKVSEAYSTGGSFGGYDPLRGVYIINIGGTGFLPPYYQFPNKHFKANFTIKGDTLERKIYVMTYYTGGNIECAALLDKDQMMLPIPIEVCKNFSEGVGGERNLYNIDDIKYSEAIIPMIIKPETMSEYTLLNLYQNWGKYPLKQISSIQFYAPYYHLSLGVTETNCIVPYYATQNARGLGTLPDHRTLSAPFWIGDVQHNSGGSHIWLQYTDSNDVYSASENIKNVIDSFGPTYADVAMDYISDDGNIKVTYTHMEMPQTDENRGYYTMEYEVLGDVSFNDFSQDFSFYTVGSNDPTGTYKYVGYLNEKNECTVVDANPEGKKQFTTEYKLGDNCPYFSYFDMENSTSTSQQGYTNLSFLILNSSFVIGGEESTPNFALIDKGGKLSLSLALDKVTLKAGDKITINAIVMPWGSQEYEDGKIDVDKGNFEYDMIIDEKTQEKYMDKNVRDVRENSLLNPLKATAVEGCEVLDSVFLPKLKTTDGKSATFTLSGGENNVAVRVYGFSILTVPKIEELVDGKWIPYDVYSAYTPDSQGNAAYYDGYCVYFDPNNKTYSYSFVTTMTDGAPRTFRITADTEFEGWPNALPDVPIINNGPTNVYLDANNIYETVSPQAAIFGDVKLSDDGSYVTFTTGKKEESYFIAYSGAQPTGQYFFIKYRVPKSNPQALSSMEFFISTENESATGSDVFYFGSVTATDEWNIIVVDLSTWEKESFKADSEGIYTAKFIRFDVFNKKYENSCSIDVSYMGMSDNLEDICALEPAVDALTYITKNKTMFLDTKTAKTYEYTEEAEGPIKLVFDAQAVYDTIPTPENGMFSKKEIGEDEDGTKYVRAYGNGKGEAYTTLLSNNNVIVTGQYLIYKYRLPSTNSAKPGNIEIYSSTTTNSAAGDNGRYAPAYNEGTWKVVIVDLSEKATYTPNEKGKYMAKFVRVDLLNTKLTADDYIDIAYVAFADDLAEAAKYDQSVATVTFYNGGKNIAYSSETGEPVAQ